MICGVLTATYGSFLTATFATWRRDSLRVWREEGLGPVPYTSEIDLDPWSWSVAPTLGGSGFDIAKKAPRITGVRVVPPSFDVHAYNLMRSQAREEGDETTSDNPRKISQDHYRAQKPPRERHSEEEKQQARDERRKKQAELEAKTSERYKAVFATRKEPTEAEKEQKKSEHSDLRPSTSPVNFGMISVLRNTIPMLQKGGGKGIPASPLPPVKEVKEEVEKKFKAPPAVLTTDKPPKTTEKPPKETPPTKTASAEKLPKEKKTSKGEVSESSTRK